MAQACPRCGHVRAVDATAPAWQCPACGIAYDKYQSYLDRAKQAVIPPAAGDLSPAMPHDGSVWMLIICNIVALVVAVIDNWTLTSLMLVYWVQSVAIGISYVLRILALEKFSTEDFTMNGRPVDPTPATKFKVALFFLAHFGFFHFVYLIFIIAESKGPVIDIWILVCAAVFAVNHFYSYRYNRELDRQGTPNIGTLMFTPYLRIVPMHLTIVFGMSRAQSVEGVLFFGALKTVADVVMHVVEHQQLKQIRTA